MALGIFAIMCPGCGTPLEKDDDGSSPQRLVAGGFADDVIVCGGCATAFVVRFGHALAVARPTDRGAL
jgi:hypothetical protein